MNPILGAEKVNSNPNVPHGTDWQSLMNYRFNVQHNGGRLDKKLIASELDIKTDTFQRHLNGTISSNADFVRRCTHAIMKHYPTETEFAEFFIPDDYVVIRRDAVINRNPEDRKKQQITLSILTGQIQELIETAYEDGKIEGKEHAAIYRKARSLIQVVTELEQIILNEVR